jgi:hypothetical protein
MSPYELSPPGVNYLVRGGGLDHGFGGITGVSINPPNADHVPWTRFVTLGFWQTYLNRHDAAVLPMNAISIAPLIPTLAGGNPRANLSLLRTAVSVLKSSGSTPVLFQQMPRDSAA